MGYKVKSLDHSITLFVRAVSLFTWKVEKTNHYSLFWICMWDPLCDGIIAIKPSCLYLFREFNFLYFIISTILFIYF